jgi:hypothetical protein
MHKSKENRRFNRRLLLLALTPAVSVLLTLFVLFSLLEAFPSLLDKLSLDSLRYYSQKREYRPDKDLVFVPRNMKAHKSTSIFIGDLYREEYGVKPTVDYLASYGANGFRTNSSQAPYDVVLIGDSYLEIGESDIQTLSEQLKAYSGLHTCNLGRSWYGPYQYVKVFQLYAVDLRPRFALFCFFSGNDIEDIQQYENWLSGGDYYEFVLSPSYLGRFKAVLSDLKKSALNNIGLRKIITSVRMYWHKEKVHPNLGIVRLGEEEMVMGFWYWNPTGTPEELINKHEWTVLSTLLADFKAICFRHEITPVVVYIPHKMEVHAELISAKSGRTVRNRLAKQLVSNDNSVTAFRRITAELDIDLVDLTPVFREAAQKGALLYYPFDTHWNPRGRQMAAQFIAGKLRKLEAGNRPKDYKETTDAVREKATKAY